VICPSGKPVTELDAMGALDHRCLIVASSIAAALNGEGYEIISR
jgi:hypothetical protein